MHINVEDIKLLCDIIIKRSLESGFSEIELNNDNYWFIASDDRINFDMENPKICVGSLFDDINGLKRILHGVNPPTPIDFDRLGNLLISVGEEISRSNKVF